MWMRGRTPQRTATAAENAMSIHMAIDMPTHMSVPASIPVYTHAQRSAAAAEDSTKHDARHKALCDSLDAMRRELLDERRRLASATAEETEAAALHAALDEQKHACTELRGRLDEAEATMATLRESSAAREAELGHGRAEVERLQAALEKATAEAAVHICFANLPIDVCASTCVQAALAKGLYTRLYTCLHRRHSIKRRVIE